MTTASSAPTTTHGFPSARTLEPESFEEACRVVLEADRAGEAIYPVGGATALDYGLPAEKPGALLLTRRLSHVEAYPSDDMTITVGAGIAWSELLRVLKEKGQTLPVDVPSPDEATLGGVIATNSSGPRRFGHGTMRDYILGIDVVSADGKRVHGGGRVVKNVAGYDFMKMHTGALGTLGVVAQVTLKVKPIPESKGAVTLAVPLNAVEKVLAKINASQTRPVACSFIRDANDASSTGRLVLLFEECRQAVDWQVHTIQKELAESGFGEIETLAAEKYDELLSSLTGWPEQVAGNVVFKANLLPSAVAPFCEAAQRSITGVSLLAHAGNGVVWGAFESASSADATKLLSGIRRLAREKSGNVVAPRCPTEWKKSLTIWGEPEPSWGVMRKLKAALDPNDTLNPGRFVPSASPKN